MAAASAAAAPPSGVLRACCANCGSKDAQSRCKACSMVFYCSRDCQVADWRKRHKQQCGKLELPDEYPQHTLQELQTAFPAHTVIDGWDVTLASLPDWVSRLEADPSLLLVVIRRRSASHVTPSDRLFQVFASGPPNPDDPTALTSSLSVCSAILVFHKDDYYHMSKQPFDYLYRFLKRRIVDAQAPATECPICMEPMPAYHAHRVLCTTCGLEVCNMCVAGIMEKSAKMHFTCPGCRDETPIKLFAMQAAQ
jgi:hypothetical protein